MSLLVDSGRWADLLDLATRDDPDTEKRRQVAHAVALLAPPAFAVAAAQAFPQDTGFPGPLWEVVAHRPWRELEPHLTDPHVRRMVAHSRVLYGEDVLPVAPWEVAHWDPEWQMPSYNLSGSATSGGWHLPTSEIGDMSDLSHERGLLEVDHPAVPVLGSWHDRVEAKAFRGTAWQAAATVAHPGSRGAEVSFAAAYPHLIHLAAGDAPYNVDIAGRAVGRQRLWAALGMMADCEPVPPFVERLRCVTWTRSAEYGWHLHLAIEDPSRDLTWTLTGDDTD
ncbi:hypothetical protein [Actinoplanes couchii]|uniref:hypothetical protein n=1 Tax=Actinoplanes couchii TaxID=403638 RepID=UPI0019427C86|nr:hypothetical protein [Actinoplanes couchii]MDR6320848.1 hypothetical protein [Actinoplanes couchii]